MFRKSTLNETQGTCEVKIVFRNGEVRCKRNPKFLDLQKKNSFRNTRISMLLNVTGVVQYLACSHYRSLRYYIESINSPCPYFAYHCPNFNDFKNGLCSHCPDEGCPRMGYHVTKPTKKFNMKYYSQTNKIYPFCGKLLCHVFAEIYTNYEYNVIQKI